MGVNEMTLSYSYILRDVESGKVQYRLDLRPNLHPSADGVWDVWEVGVAPEDERVAIVFEGLTAAGEVARKRALEMAPRYEVWTLRKVELVREITSSRVLPR